MIIYLLIALALFSGFGVGWLVWGRKPRIKRAPAVDPQLGHPIESPETIVKRELSGDGPAPFRVVTLHDGKVHYEGGAGAAARRCIEGLRTQNTEWRAYRNGQVWDWGPR